MGACLCEEGGREGRDPAVDVGVDVPRCGGGWGGGGFEAVEGEEGREEELAFFQDLIRFLPRGLISALRREEGVEDVSVVRQESLRWLARLSGGFRI